MLKKLVLNKNLSFLASKRALSAPPTELGKVVLQRMELKSPVTVRQGSVVPFDSHQQQQMIQYNPNEQLIQRVQTPLSNGTLATRSYIDSNTYNNRGILKLTHNSNGHNAPLMLQQQQQQVPSRSVFLNRAYSENPRIGYTNGYETDSGIVSSTNGYSYRTPQATQQNSTIDSMSQASHLHNPNGYRTVGGQTLPSRGYHYNNADQHGYETDTGLIKLKQVLDQRRTTSRNNVPIQQVVALPNDYYYRTNTPSVNYNYTPQQQQQTYRSNQYNTLNNNSLQEPQFVVNTYSNENEGLQFIDSADFTPQFQYANGNGRVEGNGGEVNFITTQDGQHHLILNEIDATNSEIQNMTNNFNVSIDHREYLGKPAASSHSLMVQQQRAPSAYSIRDTPSRLACASSATNISTQPQPQAYLNGQLSTSQQITKMDSKQETSRRSSANSLTIGLFLIFF